MKIRFEIHDAYKEPELHICVNRDSEEARALKDTLEKLLLSTVTVRRDREIKAARAADIVRVYSESKRVYARIGKETYEIRDRLYALEDRLKEQGFVRISNSELVNVSRIEKLDMGYTGTIKICLKNGDETFVSRRYVSSIKKVLN